MTRKHVLPLTYAPKIPAVLSGECRQTIRANSKIMPGDLVMFHGWEGVPYHSKWSFRTPYYRVSVPWPILIKKNGVSISGSSVIKWHCRLLDKLAAEDGIDPPTGEALRDVLFSMHKIPPEGLPAKIIRWEKEAVTE